LDLDGFEFVGTLPGAHDFSENLEEEEEEEEEHDEEDKENSDPKNKKNQENDKWRWDGRDGNTFVVWVKDRFSCVPRHSGYDTAGLERAISYLQRLDAEISKSMRNDLDGVLDATIVEKIRKQIKDGIDKLEDRLDKVIDKAKKKKKNASLNKPFIKEAQKITGIKGLYVSVPLLASRIARIIINGSISGGHDMEDMFVKLSKKYKLNDREKAEVMEVLFNMGLPLKMDRGYLLDEEFDPTSSDNFDYAANYSA
jgi:hypothetical protein